MFYINACTSNPKGKENCCVKHLFSENSSIHVKIWFFEIICLSACWYRTFEFHGIDLPFLFCMTQVQMKAVAKSDYGINYSFVLIPNQWPCYQISPSVQCIMLHQSSINSLVMEDQTELWIPDQTVLFLKVRDFELTGWKPCCPRF